MTRARRHLRILDAWRAPIWFTQSGLGPKGRGPLSSPPATTSQHGFHAVHNASAAADDTLDKRQDTDFQEREQGSSDCRQPGAVGRGRLRAGALAEAGARSASARGFSGAPGSWASLGPFDECVSGPPNQKNSNSKTRKTLGVAQPHRGGPRGGGELRLHPAAVCVRREAAAVQLRVRPAGCGAPLLSI